MKLLLTVMFMLSLGAALAMSPAGAAAFMGSGQMMGPQDQPGLFAGESFTYQGDVESMGYIFDGQHFQGQPWQYAGQHHQAMEQIMADYFGGGMVLQGPDSEQMLYGLGPQSWWQEQAGDWLHSGVQVTAQATMMSYQGSEAMVLTELHDENGHYLQLRDAHSGAAMW